MRTTTLVLAMILAMTFACAAGPAFAQARVLTVPEQAPVQAPEGTQAQAQAPAAPAPAKTDTKTGTKTDTQTEKPPAVPQAPAEAEKQAAPAPPPPATKQAQEPPAAPPQAEQAPAPAQAQAPAKTQDQLQTWTPGRQRAPLRQAGRYSFSRIDGGYLRLDRNSGQVAICTPRTSGWSCEAVPQDRARLEKEVDALREEVAALKKQIADLRASPPPPRVQPPPAPPPRDGGATIKLPTQADLARARGFLADTWHRLVEMIENWQKDMLRKS
jgi:hypothetical protein